MKFVYLFLCVIVSLFLPASVRAVGEFQADYDVQYAVAPSGITIVTQNISLTNLQTNLYPQKYSILIDSVKINNVIAYDPGGVIPTQITQKDGKTEIALTFNQKIVGIGKQLPFSLRYESTDIATKNGSIWEINIPGVATDPDLASYEVSLKVPASFGANAYMTPLPARAGKWTKDQMIRGGISAAYGKEQIFDVTLSYFLENPGVSPVTSEIALPPDTAFQHVAIRSLDPAPETVLVDADGNWLAQYALNAAQRISIKAELTVRVYLDPQTTATQMPLDTQIYTRPLKYWESNDTAITELAKKYTTPLAIYQYVVSTLSYDYNRVQTGGPRKGALGAITTPTQAICMEFTDLFIAIARAAGIPAREAVGYSFTNNAKLRPLSLVSDVLHAWPEYYDTEKKMWIPIDPTWANTTGGVNYFDKLDFNHITFAILGLSSEYPYPAGFYKKSGSQTKDVEVAFSVKTPEPEDGILEVQYNFPATVTSGLTAKGNVVLINNTVSAITETNARIHSSPVDVALSRTYDRIPPYAKISIPISMNIPNYLRSGSGFITTTINGRTERHVFVISPLLYRFIVPMIAVIVVLIGLFIYWLTSLQLWKSTKK